MVKDLDEHLENWFTSDQIAKLIECDQSVINSLIKGPPVLTADGGPKGDVIFIRLSDLRDYLALALEVNELLLADEPAKPAKPSKKKNPSGKKKKYVPIEVPPNCFVGKKIANKIGCEYKTLEVLIKEHGLPIAKRFGRGCLLDLTVVEKFITDHKEIAESLGIKVKPSSNEQSGNGNDPSPPENGQDKPTGHSDNTDDPDNHAGTPTGQPADHKNPEPPEGTGQDGQGADPDQQDDELKDPEDSEESAASKARELEEQNHRRTITIDRTKSGCSITAVKNAIANIDRSTIQRWIADKKITIDNEGYIDADSLKSFLENDRRTSVTFVMIKVPEIGRKR